MFYIGILFSVIQYKLHTVIDVFYYYSFQYTNSPKMHVYVFAEAELYLTLRMRKQDYILQTIAVIG